MIPRPAGHGVSLARPVGLAVTVAVARQPGNPSPSQARAVGHFEFKLPASVITGPGHS
jgi:hypothetical protein